MPKAKPQAGPDVQTGPVSPGLPATTEPAQPELFSPDAYPVRPDLVQMVKAKSFLHTGKVLSQDEELCRAVCADLLLGASDRAIARKFRISRNSIVGIELVMRERGELEPLRKAVSDELGQIILVGLRNYRDALLGNLVNPAQIPIPMAALIDKKGQLDGNVIPGTSLPAPDLTAEDIERDILEMKRAAVSAVRTIETQSTGPATEPA